MNFRKNIVQYFHFLDCQFSITPRFNMRSISSNNCFSNVRLWFDLSVLFCIQETIFSKFNLIVDMKHKKLEDNQTHLTMKGIIIKLDERIPLNTFVTNEYSS